MKRFIIIATILLSACGFNDAHAQLFNFFPRKRPVKLALVLPFNSAADNPSRDCMDFYSGALMAAEAKKAEGVNIRLKVIDLATAKAAPAKFKEDIAECDAVIGPITYEDIKTILPYCKSAGVAMVSPLDHKAAALARTEPLFFQVPTPARRQALNMAESLLYNESGMVTVFYKSRSEAYTNDVFSALDSAHVPYRKISYNVQRGRVITDSLRNALKPTARHHIIIASEDEAFASDAARNLNLLKRNNIPITVYGSSKLRNFETIDADVLYNLNLHVSTGYFIDYKNTETQNFVLKYRALFHAEPSQYAFSGYDIFTFFISAFNDLSNSFFEFVPYYTLNLLQCNIMFKKSTPDGGYVNSRTRDVELNNDFSVEVR